MKDASPKKSFFSSIKKALNSLKISAPVLLTVVLLLALIDTYDLSSIIFSLFEKENFILNPLIGGVAGSIFAGTPTTSYVLGGELQSMGVSLIAITAFIVSWVTVGVVHFPAEAVLLGKRFAIARNTSAFLFSIVIAFLTSFILGYL